ncbi:unnamed protein product, partial [Adineta steineri]
MSSPEFSVDPLVMT